MAEIVHIVAVQQKQKEVKAANVRDITQESFQKLFGGRATLKGAKVVKLTAEQYKELEAGKSIPVQEFGIFDSSEGVQLASENKLLEEQVSEKEQELAAAKAANKSNEQKIAELQKQLAANKSNEMPAKEEEKEAAKEAPKSKTLSTKK